jgi:hypothetical protein
LQDVGFNAAMLERVWAQHPPEMLLSDRSPALLRWRFGSMSGGEWRLCMALDRAGDAIAYVVWRLHGKVAEVGDFMSIDVKRWTAPLMHAFARHAREGGADAVSLMFFGSPDVIAGLKAAGYRLREEGLPVFVAKSSVEGSAEPRRWYLTGFDEDAD